MRIPLSYTEKDLIQAMERNFGIKNVDCSSDLAVHKAIDSLIHLSSIEKIVYVYGVERLKVTKDKEIIFKFDLCSHSGITTQVFHEKIKKFQALF